ncbi:MAG TPA: FAD-binding protein [Chloroflexota bacterium]|nr:FAD-binding protein [Chloroflexota bacterium]
MEHPSWPPAAPAGTTPAAPHGLAPLSGSAPHVGAVAYTLGGGIGPLARRYGYAADHVHRLELVTADGELRRVSAQEHPDLFWALRGGKGNFTHVRVAYLGSASDGWPARLRSRMPSATERRLTRSSVRRSWSRGRRR